MPSYTHACESFLPMGGQTLRQWKYNNDVPEYYVILEEKNTQKLAETERTREETALDVTMQHMQQILHAASLGADIPMFDDTMKLDNDMGARILRTRSRQMLPLCPMNLSLTFLFVSNRLLLVTRLDL